MSFVRLDKFRLVTGIDESQLPRDSALQVLSVASSIANRFCGRDFGLAIEYVVQDGAYAAISVPWHGLKSSGSIYIQGAGISGLTGEVQYTTVDQHTIRVSGVTVSSMVQSGLIARQRIARARVIENVAIVGNGPIAFIKEIRSRALSSDTTPFPEAGQLDSKDWYCDTREPNLAGEIEIYRDLQIRRRVPGMIRPVAVKSLREIEVTYYAGMVLGVPEDLQSAVCAIARDLQKDPSGAYQQESIEDYSYSRLDPQLVRKVPTSAIATLLGYQAVSM
jgi:hypothetical protein